MSRTLSWILLAFMLCSLVTWGSAFTPGAGKPQVGRREIPPRPSTEQENFLTALCETVRPCAENNRKRGLYDETQPARDDGFPAGY